MRLPQRVVSPVGGSRDTRKPSRGSERMTCGNPLPDSQCSCLLFPKSPFKRGFSFPSFPSTNVPSPSLWKILPSLSPIPTQVHYPRTAISRALKKGAVSEPGPIREPARWVLLDFQQRKSVTPATGINLLGVIEKQFLITHHHVSWGLYIESSSKNWATLF